MVRLQDMDHFGPAWTGWPANDRYNATHMLLALVTIALDTHDNAVDPDSPDSPGAHNA